MPNPDHIRYQFSPDYKNLSPETLHQLPKVVLTHEYHGEDNAVFVENLPTDHGCSLDTPDKISSMRRKYIATTVAIDSRDALERAILGGATRLRGAEVLLDDFTVEGEDIVPGPAAQWVRDRSIPVEIEDMEQLSFLYEMGFRCVINPGEGTVTDKMRELVGQGFRIEELLDLTLNAIDAAFIPKDEVVHIIYNHILPAYDEMTDPDTSEEDTLS